MWFEFICACVISLTFVLVSFIIIGHSSNEDIVNEYPFVDIHEQTSYRDDLIIFGTPSPCVNEQFGSYIHLHNDRVLVVFSKKRIFTLNIINFANKYNPIMITDKEILTKNTVLTKSERIFYLKNKRVLMSLSCCDGKKYQNKLPQFVELRSLKCYENQIYMMSLSEIRGKHYQVVVFSHHNVLMYIIDDYPKYKFSAIFYVFDGIVSILSKCKTKIYAYDNQLFLHKITLPNSIFWNINQIAFYPGLFYILVHDSKLTILSWDSGEISHTITCHDTILGINVNSKTDVLIETQGFCLYYRYDQIRQRLNYLSTIYKEKYQMIAVVGSKLLKSQPLDFNAVGALRIFPNFLLSHYQKKKSHNLSIIEV